MLCFQGRCYKAGEKTTSLEYSKAKTDFFNADQRAELKKKMIERYSKMFGKDNISTITSLVEEFFTSGAEINTHNRFILEKRIRNEIPQAEPQQVKQTTERDHNPALKSQIVSGVTSVNESNGEAERLVQSQQDQRLPPITTSSGYDVQPIQWKNEEEKWGTIYKYNAYVFKQEQKLERLRALHRQEAVKATLEEQMRERERTLQKQREEEVSFMNLNKQIKEHERQNDELKKKHVADKIQYSKEVRQKQIQENKEKRDREEQIEKDRQARAKSMIQEELRMEKQEAEDLKQKKLEEMRRVMAENEERKAILEKVREQERQEEIQMQKRAAEIQQELERARQAEFKAKADRLSDILKSSEEAVQTMKKKQADNDYKNRRYQELKDKLLSEKAARDAQAELKRKDQLKAFLKMQVNLILT
jgi:hypothetical protein